MPIIVFLRFLCFLLLCFVFFVFCAFFRCGVNVFLFFSAFFCLFSRLYRAPLLLFFCCLSLLCACFFASGREWAAPHIVSGAQLAVATAGQCDKDQEMSLKPACGSKDSRAAKARLGRTH